MSVDALVPFVRECLGRGLTRAQIEAALTQAGWSQEQVRGALAAFAAVEFPVPIPRPRPSWSARDAFLYLVLFSTLYTVSYNLASLLFDLINRALPDSVNPEPWGFRESIRWAVASLIVALPVFLYVSTITNRDTRADPARRASPVRRWLTYLTLFVSACVLVGDVVALVYNLLGGELTTRFVLKVAVVGAIAGGVFWYYLGDLGADEQKDAA
jgi:hypothetical protein